MRRNDRGRRPVGRYLVWIALGVLAFTVGSLFRLAQLTGLGLFRMFGFIGIAVGGAVLTYTVTAMQMRSGRDELLASLTSLPGAKLYRVPEPLPDVPRAVAPEVIVERSGTYYLVSSARLPDFGGRRYKRRLQAAVAQLARVGAEGEGVPVRHVLVLLRRRLREDERRIAAEHGVVLANPEDVTEVFV